MGFFSNLKGSMDHDGIKRNGLSEGYGDRRCAECKFRVDDPSSKYWYCAQHRMQVGSTQVCGHFSQGQPIYTMTR